LKGSTLYNSRGRGGANAAATVGGAENLVSSSHTPRTATSNYDLDELLNMKQMSSTYDNKLIVGTNECGGSYENGGKATYREFMQEDVPNIK